MMQSWPIVPEGPRHGIIKIKPPSRCVTRVTEKGGLLIAEVAINISLQGLLFFLFLADVCFACVPSPRSYVRKLGKCKRACACRVQAGFSMLPVQRHPFKRAQCWNAVLLSLHCTRSAHHKIYCTKGTHLSPIQKVVHLHFSRNIGICLSHWNQLNIKKRFVVCKIPFKTTLTRMFGMCYNPWNNLPHFFLLCM